MKKILLLFLGFLGMLHAQSQAVSPDSSFAGKGWTYTDFEKGNYYDEQGLQVLLQKDGAVIVVLNFGSPYIILARYLPDGSLDPAFGTDGYSEPIFMSSAGGLQPRVALQSDDKIVVASASSYYESRDITLSRYTTHGAVDKSFGTDGVISTDLGGNDDVFSLAVQSDDRIVVAGSAYDNNTSSSSLVLVRYTKDGSLDLGFDDDGKLTTELGDYYQNVFMAVQAEGTITVCRTFQHPNPGALNIVLTRYHPDGTLDVSFDGDGELATRFFDKGQVTTLAVQNDGKIILAGYAILNAEQSDFALRRYNADGSVDNGFGDEGKQTTDFGGQDHASSLAVQSDGKIVVAGYTITASFDQIDIAVARYHADGAPDVGFDGDGKLTTDFNNLDAAFSLAVQSDGKLVVTGTSIQWELFAADYLLVRYNADGCLDSGFDGDGKLIGYYPEGLSGVNSLAVQSDGKIVVAGGSGDPIMRLLSTETLFGHPAEAAARGSLPLIDVGLARYKADGSLDPAFGTNGKLVIDLGGIDEATSLVVQADGKILIAGVSRDTLTNRSYLFLSRLNADGTLDISFDGDGKLVTGYYCTGEETSLLLQRDGKIVVTGTVLDPETFTADFAVARYNADGSLDNSFNGTGRSVVDFGSPAATFSLAVQDDGKIIAAGRIQDLNTENIDFALARYNTDGSLDHSFGDNGRLTTDFASGFDLVTSVAIQADGKIVLAGVTFTYDSGNQYVVLSRYNQDGSLDSSFDGDGKLTYDLFDWKVYREPALAPSAVRNPFSVSLDLQSNGKLVVSGTTRHHSYQGLDFALARYHADGALDSSFGNQGKLTQDFLQGEDYATSLRICRDKLYVVGTSTVNAPIERGVLAAYRFDCADQELCGNRLDDNCDGQIDEGCPAQPFLTLNDVTVSEDLQRATLMVTLSKKMDQPVSFSYFTVDRTATSKPNKGIADYVAKSGTLTIPAGQQTVVISINILDDNFTEGEEYFDVHLQRPVGAAMSGDKGRVTIQDGQPSVGIDLTSSVPEKEEAGVQKLSVTVQPNPSGGAFTLVLQSPNNSPITLKVTDASGRLVDAKAGIAPNTTLQVGHNYRPGVYYADVVQGSERVNLKLVKQ